LRELTQYVRLAVAGTLLGVKTHYLHILKALTQRYRNDEFEDVRKAPSDREILE
jgi:hypothetical protein